MYQNGLFLGSGGHSGTIMPPESQIIPKIGASMPSKDAHLEPYVHPEGQQILKILRKIM